jgi:hypothetical protein
MMAYVHDKGSSTLQLCGNCHAPQAADEMKQSPYCSDVTSLGVRLVEQEGC